MPRSRDLTLQEAIVKQGRKSGGRITTRDATRIARATGFSSPATQASRAIGNMARKGLVERHPPGVVPAAEDPGKGPQNAPKPHGHNSSHHLRAFGKDFPL